MELLFGFISYFISLLLCFGVPIFVYKIYLKKIGQKLSLVHGLLGFGSFLICLAGYFLLLKCHLSIKDGVSQYYNTTMYRVTIISLFVCVVVVLLWLITMRTYVRTQSVNACRSFYVGFGIAPVFALGLYALFMLLFLAFSVLGADYLGFDAIKGAYQFAPESYVFTFTPIFGHVSYSLAFLSILLLFVCFAIVLGRMAVKNLNFKIVFSSFLILLISALIMINLITFSKLFAIAHYLLAIILCLLDAVLIVFAIRVNQYEPKPFLGYEKQFD